MTDGWKVYDRRFRYNVSRLTVFAHDLKVAQLERHFSLLGTSPDDLEVPFDEMPEVDVFVIRPHPTTTPLPLLTWEHRAVRYVPIQYKRSYTQLTGTFEEYLKSFSPKSRKNRQREVRQYVAFAGDPAPWKEYRTPEELAEFYVLAREVAKKTFQEGIRGAGLPASAEFQAEMARLGALGSVSGHLLFHGPTPVGYIYLVYRGDIVDFEYTGFDPAYRERSPGSVLIMKVLEGLFATGRYRIFDFGETEGNHKDTFSTHQIPSADIYYFRRRPKPLAAVAGQAGIHYLTRSAKSVLARAKVADHLKRAVGAVRAHPPEAHVAGVADSPKGT